MWLTDLFSSKPKWYSSSPKTRLVAIKDLDDQSILTEIARNDKDEKVRIAAVEKLLDKRTLIEIAKDGSSFDKPADAASEAAVNKLEDKSDLLEVFDNKSTRFKVCSIAIGKITDQDILKKCAVDSEEKWKKALAVERIDDEDFLVKVAKSDIAADVRNAAMGKIKNENILSDIKNTEIALISEKLNNPMRYIDVIILLGRNSGSMTQAQVMGMTGMPGNKSTISMREVDEMIKMQKFKYVTWDRPEGHYKLVFEDDALSRLYSVPDCITESMNEKNHASEKQLSQHNNLIMEKIVNFLNENPLNIGTIEEFRKGQRDFQKWGEGVLIGTKEWIIKKLSAKFIEIGVGNLSSIKHAQNYSWQNSNIEGFSIRIEISLTAGMLAGYYIGRFDDQLFGLFGFGFNDDESENLPGNLVV